MISADDEKESLSPDSRMPQQVLRQTRRRMMHPEKPDNALLRSDYGCILPRFQYSGKG
jgi:hypothetical protein